MYVHVLFTLLLYCFPLSPSPSPSLSPLSSPSLSRGYIYHTVNIDNGWLVQCNGLILYRKKSFDEGNSTNYCVRLNEKLEVIKICNLIFHTSCLILHVSYFMSHTSCLILHVSYSILPCLIASCFVHVHTLILQTFKHSILHSRRQRPCPVILLS